MSQRLVGGHSVSSLCMHRQHEAKESSGGVLYSACHVQHAQTLPCISAAQECLFCMLFHHAQLPWLYGSWICRCSERSGPQGWLHEWWSPQPALQQRQCRVLPLPPAAWACIPNSNP